MPQTLTAVGLLIAKRYRERAAGKAARSCRGVRGPAVTPGSICKGLAADRLVLLRSTPAFAPLRFQRMTTPTYLLRLDLEKIRANLTLTAESEQPDEDVLRLLAAMGGCGGGMRSGSPPKPTARLSSSKATFWRGGQRSHAGSFRCRIH